MANRQHLIEQRDKIQFHSDLAFGKITEKRTTQITVSASTALDTPLSHDYPTKPSIIGWAEISGDTRQFPLADLNLITLDEFGYDLEIFPYATASGFGFYVDNQSVSQRVLTLTYWLYFV